MRSCLVASFTGFNEFFSRLASTNRSMSVFAHLGSETLGTGGAASGWRDQNFRRSGVITYFPSFGAEEAVVTALFGQIAPAFTQAVSSLISLSSKRPPKGIFKFGSLWRTAWMRRLLSGSPGTMAGTRFPPLAMPSGLSRASRRVGTPRDSRSNWTRGWDESSTQKIREMRHRVELVPSTTPGHQECQGG